MGMTTTRDRVPYGEGTATMETTSCDYEVDESCEGCDHLVRCDICTERYCDHGECSCEDDCPEGDCPHCGAPLVDGECEDCDK